MQPASRWGQSPIVGARKDTAVGPPPAFLAAELWLEWEIVTTAHHNLLLVGLSDATEAMLGALKRYLRQPLTVWTPTTGVAVPDPREGTLVLVEVARLDRDQQSQLFRWLRFHEQVQVVSTTSEPLFSLVENSTFSADLYYRLNIVRMELTSADESRPAR